MQASVRSIYKSFDIDAIWDYGEHERYLFNFVNIYIYRLNSFNK